MSKNNEEQIVLEVQNIRKKFGTGKNIVNAIDNASFEVKKGEVVGLIGESGSGKTTIGRTIIRLHNSDAGSIKILGKEIGGYKISKLRQKFLNKNIQMIFQDPYSSLNSQKNIMGIIAEPLIINGIDKQDLDDTLKSREKILDFFPIYLSSLTEKTVTKYEIFKLQEGIKIYKLIEKEMKMHLYNKDDNRIENANKWIHINYSNKEAGNSSIIDGAREVPLTLLDHWKSVQIKTETKNFETKTEKEVFDVEAEREYLLENVKVTKVMVKAKKDLSLLLTRKKEINSNWKTKILIAKNELKNKLEYEKSKASEYRNNMHTSKEWNNFNFFRFLWRKNVYLVSFIKEIMKIEDFSLNNTLNEILDFEILLSKTYKKTMDDLHANKKPIKDETKYFTDINKEISSARVKIITKFQERSVELKGIYLSKINPVMEDISKVRTLIKDEKIIAKGRDINSIKKRLDEVTIKLEKIRSINQKNIEEFRQGVTAEHDIFTDTKNKKISELENEFNELREKVNAEFDSRINKLFEFNKEIMTKEEIKKIKNDQSKIKNIIKFKEDNNSLLKLEEKVIRNEINTILALMGQKKKYFIKNKIKTLLRRKRVYKVLTEVGLSVSHAYRYPHEFSGGMRQRVGIARAIVSEPELIIADEPIAALDLSIQAQVVNLLLELKEKRGLSMIFIAHDLSMVRFNSDRILIMHLGKIVEYGKTDEIFKKPIHPYTSNLINSMPEINKISKGFDESEFDPKYLEKYSITNQPTYQEISKNHFVLATKPQFKKWNK